MQEGKEMRYSVLFNGERCEDYGIFPVERPNIPAPSKDREEIVIPGSSGILTMDNKRYEPINISVEFNFLAKANEWNDMFRRAKRWLSGSGELEFSDDAEYFYKVSYVNVDSCERDKKRIGRFAAEFICDPFTYLKNGKREYDSSEVLYNPYYEAHPVYKIAGEGVCILSVNGQEMKANVGQNLTIDTDRMLTFRNDGVMNNTAVSGDYQDMYLQKGSNKIEISPGFSLKVIPNWRTL